MDPPLFAAMRNENEETLEELRPGGLRILQKKRGFRFGLEAVLLADFAQAPAGARVADLGTGTGVLPLLMIERGKGAAFDALERDPDMAEMAGRTMALNGLEDRVRVRCLSVEDAAEALPAGCADHVVSNPPHFPAGDPPSPDALRAGAMVQAAEGLLPWYRAAARLLRSGGLLSLVLRAEGLAEAMAQTQACSLTPKRLRLVHATAEAPAKLALLECRRNGKPGLQVLPPLLLDNEAEMRRIYG